MKGEVSSWAGGPAPWEEWVEVSGGECGGTWLCLEGLLLVRTLQRHTS